MRLKQILTEAAGTYGFYHPIKKTEVRIMGGEDHAVFARNNPTLFGMTEEDFPEEVVEDGTIDMHIVLGFLYHHGWVRVNYFKGGWWFQGGTKDLVRETVRTYFWRFDFGEAVVDIGPYADSPDISFELNYDQIKLFVKYGKIPNTHTTEKLSESIVDVSISMNHRVEVYVNPSRYDILKMLKNSDHGTFRGVLGSKLLVWNADETTHDHIDDSGNFGKLRGIRFMGNLKYIDLANYGRDGLRSLPENPETGDEFENDDEMEEFFKRNKLVQNAFGNIPAKVPGYRRK